MIINPTRVVNVSELRASISAALDSAASGRTTHVTRDGEVIAHLVPANALVHDGNQLLVMMGATIDAEAKWLADEAGRAGIYQAGDSWGMVLGWYWQCDPEGAVEWLARYCEVVAETYERQGWMRPDLDTLWSAISGALGVRVSQGDRADFEAAARAGLPGYTSIYTREELAGQPRPRSADDPWPDSRHPKIQWAQLPAGAYIPDPTALTSTLPSDDHWVRVAAINGDTVELQNPSTYYGAPAATRTYAPRSTVWTPFRTGAPYRWG